MAVLEAAGIVFFLHGLRSHNDAEVEELRRSALRLAMAAALLVVLQHLVAPARLAANFSGIFDNSLQDFYLNSNAGIAHGIRLAGMLVIVVGVASRSRWLALAGAVLACLSFAAMGHTTTYSPTWLPRSLLFVHVTIVAFWFGSLRSLRGMSGSNHIAIAARLDEFSRVASRAVPFIFVAGLGLAIVFLDSFADLVTSYGLMIVGKVGGFAVLIGLASLNRWRLVPGIRAGRSAAVLAFRNSVATEWAIIVLVIVSTVVMTSLFSP